MSEENQTAIDLETLNEIASEAEAVETEAVNMEPEAPQIETKEMILPIVQFGTAVLCPNWQIMPEENEMLADSYAALLDKYFPDVGGNFGVELNALLITAAVFGTRIGKPRILPKPGENESGQPEDQPAGTQTTAQNSDLAEFERQKAGVE